MRAARRPLGGDIGMERVLRIHDELQKVGEYRPSLDDEAAAAFDASIGHLVHAMRLLVAEAESVRDA